MTRRHITFECEGAVLAGTIDEGAAASGLLIVSGGNEIRSGAWSGQAQLAAGIAAEGFPVMRFDRRGVGDSEGGNGEFRSSGPDIAAAFTAFRRECPHLERVIAHGNCDAASALMLNGGGGADGLVLSNPWTIEEDDAPQPAAVLREHYRGRLADSGAIKRLLTGQVSIAKLVSSLRDAIRPAAPVPTGLAAELMRGLGSYFGPVIFPVAARDRTGQTFAAVWSKGDQRIRTCPDATHSFVEPHAREWLASQILELLRD